MRPEFTVRKMLVARATIERKKEKNIAKTYYIHPNHF